MRDSEILSGTTFSNSPSSVDSRVCAMLPAPRLWLLTLEVPSEDGGMEEKEDIERWSELKLEAGYIAAEVPPRLTLAAEEDVPTLDIDLLLLKNRLTPPLEVWLCPEPLAVDII